MLRVAQQQAATIKVLPADIAVDQLATDDGRGAMFAQAPGVGDPQGGHVVDFADVVQDIGSHGDHGQADVVDGAGPGAVHGDGAGVGVRGEDDGFGEIAVVVPADVHRAEAVVAAGFAVCEVLVKGAAGADVAREGDDFGGGLVEVVGARVPGEFEQCELGAVGGDTANVAVGALERDVHRRHAVFSRVQHEKVQTQRDGDGVGDLGEEVPVVEGFAEVVGNLGPIGNELFIVSGGELERGGLFAFQAPDMTGSRQSVWFSLRPDPGGRGGTTRLTRDDTRRQQYGPSP